MNINFLLIHYNEVDFLINRKQFFSSIFLEQEIRIKSPLIYLSSITPYQDEHILIFDLDRYLTDNFVCTSRGNSRLILITDTGSFTREGQEWFGRLRFKNQDREFSRRFMALKIANHTELLALSLLDLKLFPPSLRAVQHETGCLGVRFPGLRGAQLFVDSERIFINSLLNKSFRA